MGARASWTGGIEFGGFQLPVSIYTLAPSRQEGFKSLCPCHLQPIEQKKLCATTGEVIAHEELVKSVVRGSGKHATYHPLDEDVMERIGELTGQRTQSAPILKFVGLDSVPWHLSTGRYRLVPNEKVAGAADTLETLWNGLADNGWALITRWAKRAGSPPTKAAIYPNGNELEAVELPNAEDVRDDDPDVPVYEFTERPEAGATFAAFAAALKIEVGDFELSEFPDEVAAERTRLIDMAVKGTALPAVQKPEAAPEPTVDLMAMMKASLAAAGDKPAKKSRAKAAA